MRISYWSSDVCSSDLIGKRRFEHRGGAVIAIEGDQEPAVGRDRDCLAIEGETDGADGRRADHRPALFHPAGTAEGRRRQRCGRRADRKGVVWGKSVSVRVVLVGGRIIKKKKPQH